LNKKIYNDENQFFDANGMILIIAQAWLRSCFRTEIMT